MAQNYLKQNINDSRERDTKTKKKPLSYAQRERKRAISYKHADV